MARNLNPARKALEWYLERRSYYKSVFSFSSQMAEAGFLTPLRHLNWTLNISQQFESDDRRNTLRGMPRYQALLKSTIVMLSHPSFANPETLASLVLKDQHRFLLARCSDRDRDRGRQSVVSTEIPAAIIGFAMYWDCLREDLVVHSANPEQINNLQATCSLIWEQTVEGPECYIHLRNYREQGSEVFGTPLEIGQSCS